MKDLGNVSLVGAVMMSEVVVEEVFVRPVAVWQGVVGCMTIAEAAAALEVLAQDHLPTALARTYDQQHCRLV